MDNKTVVTPEEWLDARKALLAKEKEFTQAREALASQRRELPWVRIDKDYAFQGPGGKVPLADLFADHRQLIVCHFMYGPDWTEGCPSCSFWADGYDPMVVHLAARDTAFVAVSRTSLANIDAYKKRMGWHFNWVSSLDSDFNQDFAVSFTKAQMESGAVPYNYATAAFPSEEGPGLSVFYKNADGEIFHTYSCYARGLDMMNTAYHLLDLTPKGRDEDGLPFTMAWVR
ncbi:MAG: DUF899 domain-containing protein, partial [Hyphomicrobiaceae bacterium]